MIITLTTDFGLSDPFVGIMKGVILGIAPDVQLVDLTHDIRSYDILDGAFRLASAYRFFPHGTIHLVVVDPGVGSARRPLAASTADFIFVGPDNGVFSMVFNSDLKTDAPAVYHITNDSLFLHPVSQTFHGRDIFAPVAAHLARGLPLDSVGPRIFDFVTKPFPRQVTRAHNTVMATVLRVDKFGNIVTNLTRDDLRQGFCIQVGGVEVTSLFSSYAEAQAGQVFAIEGSSGYVEIALNRGSAAEKLNIQSGAEIKVETVSANH